jgi:hypothetical protein
MPQADVELGAEKGQSLVMKRFQGKRRVLWVEPRQVHANPIALLAQVNEGAERKNEPVVHENVAEPILHAVRIGIEWGDRISKRLPKLERHRRRPSGRRDKHDLEHADGRGHDSGESQHERKRRAWCAALGPDSTQIIRREQE